MHKDKLDRLLRVRTLQLGLAHAEEIRAQERFAGEASLKSRIRELAEGVAPSAAAAPGFSLMAAAHYRDRLQQSAEAAEGRLRAASQVVARAAAATREAKRDQSAIEKLIARSDAEAALKAIRALEAAPPTRKAARDPA